MGVNSIVLGNGSVGLRTSAMESAQEVTCQYCPCAGWYGKSCTLGEQFSSNFAHHEAALQRFFKTRGLESCVLSLNCSILSLDSTEYKLISLFNRSRDRYFKFVPWVYFWCLQTLKFSIAQDIFFLEYGATLKACLSTFGEDSPWKPVWLYIALGEGACAFQEKLHNYGVLLQYLIHQVHPFPMFETFVP